MWYGALLTLYQVWSLLTVTTFEIESSALGQWVAMPHILSSAPPVSAEIYTGLRIKREHF